MGITQSTTQTIQLSTWRELLRGLLAHHHLRCTSRMREARMSVAVILVTLTNQKRMVNQWSDHMLGSTRAPQQSLSRHPTLTDLDLVVHTVAVLWRSRLVTVTLTVLLLLVTVKALSLDIIDLFSKHSTHVLSHDRTHNKYATTPLN